MVLLPKEHRYRLATSAFNAKPERTQSPTIMMPFELLKAYEREKEKEFAESFIQMRSLCSMIQNYLTPMLRNYPL